MTDPTLTATFHTAMADIPATAWDALVPAGAPHLRHAFLNLAEESGSVSEHTGWAPCHLTLEREDRLVAAMPLYQKSHSWGEFVFDWSWADAYQRAGLDYYPKLVSVSPFTPATAGKLLVRPGEDQGALRIALLDVAKGLAQEHDFSSIHLQFLPAGEREACGAHGWLIRSDCQFHWHNRDYADFDAFLATFSSKKRKNVKRERRRIREAGIRHRIVAGDELTDALVSTAWDLCRRTFVLRGHEPYLTREFFLALRRVEPSPLVLVLAEAEERIVAAAILLQDSHVLLGRYWGSEDHYHSLHFETCYYQGIEWCIRNRIPVFEPGTQGEHKVARGFVPSSTGSAHWLAHPQFSAAVADYLEREARGVQRYMHEVDAHVPYRRETDSGDG